MQEGSSTLIPTQGGRVYHSTNGWVTVSCIVVRGIILTGRRIVSRSNTDVQTVQDAVITESVGPMILSVHIVMSTMAVVRIYCRKEIADGKMMGIRMVMRYDGMRQQGQIGEQ